MTRFTRRHALALGSGALLLPSSLRAQATWPSGPVTFVVGYAAGGGADINARELAKKLEGVNEEQFLKTIKEWNAAVMTEVPFNPAIKDGRSTRGLAVPKSNWALTIDEPPFEAYAVTCGLTFTFGGLKITTSGEVESTDGQPIPGLFAAGELVGGLFYHNYPGCSGLVSGAVLGKLAGDGAGRYVKGKN